MTLFNDVIRGAEVKLTRRPIAKDATVGDVHVGTALGNSEAPQLPFPKMPHPELNSHGVPEADDADEKKKKPKPQAFIGYSKPRQVVVSEELGPGSNAEDGPAGVTVKRLYARKQAPFHPTLVGDAVERDDGFTEDPDTDTDATTKRYSSTRDLPKPVKGKLKGKKRRQWMHVFNSSLASHGDESRAFAEAWSTVKKVRSDALSGEPMVGVGGRRLEPFDEGTFFVPMRYDPSALSYLRPDQVPFFLDALTHPDRLQVRPLPIRDLVAVKGRVSRDTIQKHLDRMGQRRAAIHHVTGDTGRYEGSDDLDPPVVVFMNGVFYIADGHDRTVAMWLDGIDVVDAAFEDIDAYNDQKPDPDNEHRNTAYALLQGVDGRTLTNYVDGTLAVPFMADPSFFSHLRPDQVPKFTYAVTHPDKLSDAKVALASLVAIQNRVNVDTVAEKVEQGWKKPPVIVRMNDVNYIADGHDRLTASWLRGDDEVGVKLTDITWADNSMRPADIVKSTIEDRARAQERLEAAEGLVKSISEQVDAVNRELVEKQAEVEARRAEVERLAVEKQAETDRYEAEKRAEVEDLRKTTLEEATRKVAEVDQQLRVKRIKVDRKLEAADDYVAEMERAQKRLDRYVVDQQESVDRQVAKVQHELELAREEAEREVAGIRKAADQKNHEVDLQLQAAEREIAKLRKELDRKTHEVDLKLREADSYVEYVAKAKRKANRKLERAVEKADAYLAEKRAEADQYVIEKRASADQYDLDTRTDADRYSVAKRQETDEREFDRKRELNKMELGQLDEIQSRATTELSARQIAQIQVLKKQLRTGARQLKVEIRKADEDKRQIFGWASVVTRKGEPVVDKQNDIIPVEELEPAVYEYMLTSRDGGNMHAIKGVARCIESMMWTVEKAEAMGTELPDGIEGWWVGYQVDCPDLWQLVKDGNLLEFSIGGQAVPVRLED